MTRLLKAAWVIGRRDFTATVFSKTFIFFLLTPLFPVVIGVLFGGIGARVATQAAQPRVAVVASAADFARLDGARDRLQSAFGERPMVELVRAEPAGPPDAQQRDLLASKSQPVVAVLTGGLAQPRLTGTMEPNGTIAGQVRAMVESARAPPPSAPPVAVRATASSTGSESRSRAITAQMGQTILFFLTLILATMMLSQLIEEKSNKIIEVVAAAVPIEAIFLGKLFAMLAASIVGLIVWVTAGAAAVSLLAPGGTGSLPTPAVGPAMFLLFIAIYFSMNYLLLGSVFLSIGAQASSPREVQTLSMPASVAQILVFGFAALAVGSVGSTLAIAGAIFPLSSPLVMVAYAAEEPALWPHALAIAWQILWIGIVIVISARLFRKTVLKSGPVKRSWWRRASA
ncbi:ABC transporter permease [Sphingomonas sabuli]|uniref:ABC transporter permease n=1 Tax=Sphingomonas sabuli TaxID=2764186 RepID=A0A7G9KZE3_9SPHN|nr:ABC transporter permease [Sphingomonas sabuli]QNM81742.1 ABC transporter permease [Sphingomonas sabuli]